MPSARDLAVDALLEVEAGVHRAREAAAARRAEVTDPRDRGLLTELVYGVVRRLATLDAVLAAFSKTPLPRLEPVVRAALRVGLHQLLFLDRVPPFAAVDAAVETVKRHEHPRLAGFVNGVLRTIHRAVTGPATGPEAPRHDVPRPGAAPLRLSRPVFPDPARALAANLGARYAHPAWLVERWLARHGEAGARAMLEAGITRPPLSLRARPGRRDEVLAALAAAGVGAHPGAGPDEVVAPDGDAEALGVVRDGLAAVQDGTAQRVATLAAPGRGERVLDLCAAPGGKTLHLLDLLDLREGAGGAGEVVACDVDPAKVTALATLLAGRPTGGAAASAVVVPPDGPLPFPRASFDVVVVDAPCSNTGVLRRRPEARARLTPADVTALARAQRALLERAWPLLRPGGRLVYATCSVEPEEDGDVVAAFAAAHPDARVEPGFDVRPAAAADGGFAAVLHAPRG